jgi:thiol:disulfide interchange protein DsbD
MTQHRHRTIALLATLIIAPALTWAGPSDTPAASKPPDVKVSLIADRAGVEPGGTATLGLQFKIPDEWHIYWRFQGDSGLPPAVKWTLPDGATVGELKFPTPNKHVDKANLTTYILEGEPVLLVEFTAPKNAPAGSALSIRGDVEWLVCKELCIRQTATVSLDLPVVASAADAKPANAEQFEEARAALPLGPKAAKHVTVETALSQNAVRPGDKVEAAVVLNVADGHHVQSNKPASEFLIPTDVLVIPIDGVLNGAIKYPAPYVHTDQLGEKQSEFKGKAVIRIPLEAESGFAGNATLGGLVTFQVCNDKTGMCYAPQTVEWSLPIPHAAKGAEVKPTNTELFASAGGDAQSGGSGNGPRQAGGAPLWPLWKVLLFAFIGGAILNIMPCVLPVISIKILSFVQQAGEHRSRILALGLVYTAGILASFLAMAIVMVILQNQGKSAGWGVLLSNAVFVQVMIFVIFAFGLSLLGVFMVNLPGSATNALAGAEAKEGYPGAFFKGVLAVALATPCTAPILAPALGVAFALPQGLMVLALMFVGLGLAFPYLLLSAVPAWMKFLPRPGMWMERFKQFMGFLLMATVVWLLWILQQLVEPNALIMTLAFLCVLGLSLWMIGLVNVNTPPIKRAATWLTAVAISVVGGFWAFQPEPPGIEWRTWEQGLPERLAGEGYTVYVDFTAAWCATCQANKKLVLETEDVRRRLASMEVVMLKADYTKYPPDITEELKRYERAGVPLNIIYPANKPDSPILLPELLTKGIVFDKLTQAGRSVAKLDDLPLPAETPKLAATSLR